VIEFDGKPVESMKEVFVVSVVKVLVFCVVYCFVVTVMR
jgi:hypothetical protein